MVMQLIAEIYTDND